MKYASGKKMTETLHHALRAIMQFPVLFFCMMDTSILKQKNKFIPYKEIIPKS
jgi:ATP adenylyltransferase/5',5'''-P-1,P-4-tetraphosphate phosphorylase II